MQERGELKYANKGQQYTQCKAEKPGHQGDTGASQAEEMVKEQVAGMGSQPGFEKTYCKGVKMLYQIAGVIFVFIVLAIMAGFIHLDRETRRRGKK